MELQAGMWVLLMNDMRMAHFEDVVPAACAETKEELEQFVKDETVELYKTDNQGRVPPTPPDVKAGVDVRTGELHIEGHMGDVHMSNAKWCKTFRHGGPLEWFNKTHDLDGHILQFFPPDEPPPEWEPPEVPHISELRPEGTVVSPVHPELSA